MIGITFFCGVKAMLKLETETIFWIFTSHDQLCCGDEGSVSEISVDLGQWHVTAQLAWLLLLCAGKNSRVILVLCDKLPTSLVLSSHAAFLKQKRKRLGKHPSDMHQLLKRRNNRTNVVEREHFKICGRRSNRRSTVFCCLQLNL